MKLATCHPNRKHQARGLCGSCYMRWLKENNPAYSEKIKEYQTEYHKTEHAAKSRSVRAKAFRASTDPDKVRRKRNKMLRSKYGINIEQYDAILESQGGGCAICSRKPGKIALHVDHCHSTGVVRGVLCHQCNWYLGTIEGGPSVLENLLNYISKHKIYDKLKMHQS